MSKPYVMRAEAHQARIQLSDPSNIKTKEITIVPSHASHHLRYYEDYYMKSDIPIEYGIHLTRDEALLLFNTLGQWLEDGALGTPPEDLP